MGGMDPTAEVTRKKLRSGEYFFAEHVRRDMQHMLSSIAHHVGDGGFLLCDERPMLQQIADDYGLEWPDEL